MNKLIVPLTRLLALVVVPLLFWGGFAYAARHPLKEAAHEMRRDAHEVRLALASSVRDTMARL